MISDLPAWVLAVLALTLNDDRWPFDAAEAARRQAEAARAISSPDPLRISLEGGAVLSFRLIPAGSFEMGSPATEPGHEGDEALHPERLTEPFYVMDTQLTVEACRALHPGTAANGDAKEPAAVPYREAVDQILPALAKLAPKGWKAVLPDRVRLEYAARAGVAGMNPGGDRPADAADYAWTRENSENKVHPVAQKKPNAWGLYDVLGNRWHWFWVGPGSNGDASTGNHLVYGGTYSTPASGNGARLANIMVSQKPEGVRFALLREGTPLPKGHPELPRGN